MNMVFFKQKTAYKMRISDWSSDECSSDLVYPFHSLEPAWRVQQDLRGTGGEGRQARPVDDRCHPPEGAPGSGQPAQKRHVPGRIGHPKGGLCAKLSAISVGTGRPATLPSSEGKMRHDQGTADDRCIHYPKRMPD